MKQVHGALDPLIIECLASGKYRVAPDGVVWNLRPRGGGSEKKLKQTLKNYWMVSLRGANKNAAVYVHRMVAIAFLGAPSDQSMHVDHIDGVKTNNKIENLEWVDRDENVRRAKSLGLLVSPHGSRHWNSRLSEADVFEIHRMSNGGSMAPEIARRFGITRTNVSNILLGVSWGHIHQSLPEHEKSKRHYPLKITTLEAKRIVELGAVGTPRSEIAASFGISLSHVGRVLRREIFPRISRQRIGGAAVELRSEL